MDYFNNKSFCRFFFVTSLVLPFFCGTAWADDFQFKPSISLKQEYNDNISFTQDNEVDDLITTVTPAIYLKEKTERLEFTLNSKLDVVGYWDNDTLNALDHKHDAGFSYSFTPLLSMSAGAMYEKDSRTDRDLETTGLVLDNSKREKQFYNFGGSWIASEIIQTGASVFYGRSDFTGSTNNSDSSYEGISAGISVNLEEYFPKMTGKTNFTYVRYDFTSTVTKDYLLTMGLDYNLTERYVISGEIGPRYTESDSYGQTGDDWGVGGKLGVDIRLDELSDLSFFVEQEVTEVSGSAGTVERTSLTTAYTKRIYGDWVIGVNAEYRKNKSKSSVSNLNTDEDYYSLSPRLTYKITDDLSMQSVYRFTAVDENNSNGGTDSRNRNLVFATVTYRYPDSLW